MKKLAIIGAGVSGLTVNRLLADRYDVKVFERESVPGGLIRCKTWKTAFSISAAVTFSILIGLM